GWRELPQLVRRSDERREGAVMARHAALDAEQLERECRLAWIHRVVAADREDGDVRLVQPGDELHVAEDARVAGEVDPGAVHPDDDAARLSHVLEVVVRGRVVRVREREGHTVDVDRAALVRVADVLELVLDLQPVGELDGRDDGRAVLLRVLRALRVAVQERVDVDALAARRVDAKGRMSEPGECRVSHGPRLTMRSGTRSRSPANLHRGASGAAANLLGWAPACSPPASRSAPCS